MGSCAWSPRNLASTGCPDEEPALFALAVSILGVDVLVDTRHSADHMVEDLLGDGAKEFVSGHRLTSERSQAPGVEVDVCLATPHSCELP